MMDAQPHRSRLRPEDFEKLLKNPMGHHNLINPGLSDIAARPEGIAALASPAQTPNSTPF